MIKLFIFVFILSIWHSFLFYGKELGLSVILFILPLLGITFYVLKKWDKIERIYGLFFIIPIILLSCCYFIYDNYFFKMLNVIVIPFLFLLMYIITIRPSFKVFNLVKDCFALLLAGPLGCVFDVIEIVLESLFSFIKLSKNSKKRIKSFLLILPVVIVILWLLISADMVFDSMIGDFFRGIYGTLEYYFSGNLFGRVILIVIIFLYISSTFYFIVLDYLDFVPDARIDEINDSSKIVRKFKLDIDTIQMLFVVLSIIYVIFDFIQIKSLMFHSVSSNINYAEYARQGFFQLMFVSLINLGLILFSKKYYNCENKDKVRFLKVVSLLMIVLTFVIILSSFLRMNLYESQYGYTLLRLLVYITLITEIILLVPTSLYIIKNNYNILKAYMVILISVYVIINFINVDKVIAIRNIKRYYDKKDIDIEYLENYSSDNLGELVKFYKKVDDKEVKDSLENYFKELNLFISCDGIQEFNISKCKGEELLKKYK